MPGVDGCRGDVLGWRGGRGGRGKRAGATGDGVHEPATLGVALGCGELAEFVVIGVELLDEVIRWDQIRAQCLPPAGRV